MSTTKHYHLFCYSYDVSAMDAYEGTFTTLEAAYQAYEKERESNGEIAVKTPEGGLRLFATADIQSLRTETSWTKQWGWKLVSGGFHVVRSEVEQYKATKQDIERAAREFAEREGVQFLGVTEFHSHDTTSEISVTFDWQPKYNTNTFVNPHERVERKTPYSWGFDDNERVYQTAEALIMRTVGEKLREDRMQPHEWREMEAKRRYMTGLT